MVSILEQTNAKRITRLKRDLDICERYLSGETLDACGRRYKIKRQRVKQIIKKRGVWRPRVVSHSDRDEFLGVNITESDKLALKLEAERRGMSMSELTAEMITLHVPKLSLTEEIAEREAQLADMKDKAAL